jgi:YihY family inner membrane protein
MTTAVSRIDRWQRSHPIPAFAVAVIRKGGDDQAGALAGLIAYFAFLAIFPLLLVLVTVAGWVLANHPDLRDRLLNSALSQFPVVGTDLRANVGSINGRGWVVVLGLLGALWAGLGLGRGLQRAFDTVWVIPTEQRPLFVAARLRSLAIVAILGVTLVVGTVAAALLAGVGRANAIGRVGGAALTAVIILAAILALFRVLTPHEPWGVLWPGAVLATSGWLGLQALGAWFVSRVVHHAGNTYGVFAIVIGLLVWLSLLARLLVVAAEVNVVRARQLWPRSLLPPRPVAPTTSRRVGRQR